MLLSKKQIKRLAPFGLVFLIIAYLGDPLKGPIVPCIFNKITGLYCPGCGMTRAINSLMHFKLVEAIKYNLLSILIPVFLGIYLLLEYRQAKKLSKIIIYLMISISIIYGFIRNFSLFNYL